MYFVTTNRDSLTAAYIKTKMEVGLWRPDEPLLWLRDMKHKVFPKNVRFLRALVSYLTVYLKWFWLADNSACISSTLFCHNAQYFSRRKLFTRLDMLLKALDVSELETSEMLVISQIVSKGLWSMVNFQIGSIFHLVCFGAPIFCNVDQRPSWGFSAGNTLARYADDYKAFRVMSCPDDQLMFQGDLDKRCTWSQQNRMEFNVQKCKLMRITRKRQPLIFNLSLNGTVLEEIDKFRGLGLLTNHALSWNSHIDTITSKANGILW